MKFGRFKSYFELLSLKSSAEVSRKVLTLAARPQFFRTMLIRCKNDDAENIYQLFSHPNVESRKSFCQLPVYFWQKTTEVKSGVMTQISCRISSTRRRSLQRNATIPGKLEVGSSLLCFWPTLPPAGSFYSLQYSLFFIPEIKKNNKKLNPFNIL